MFNVFKSKKALRLYGITVLAAAFSCVVLRLISTMFFFDGDIAYYQTGAVLPIITNVIMALTAIGAIVFCLISKVSVEPNMPVETKVTRIASIIAAVGFAVFGVIYVSSLMEYSNIYGSIPTTYLLCAICTFGSCAFFALKAFRASNADILYVLMGILVAVWLVLELAECYFDTFIPMNSPLKLTFEFACLGALLLTVNEMRVGLDQKRRGFHLFAATVASVFLPTSAIPSIICYLSGDMPASYVLVYSDLVMLGISVLAVARLVQLCFYEQAEPTESETEIQDSDEEQIEEQSSDSAEVQE